MIYDFKCSVCGAIEVDVFLSIHHTDDDHPKCCYGEPMGDYITRAPQVHWKDYDLPDGGFKATHDGTVITSRKQNRDYMARNGLKDANETFKCPTHLEQKEQHADALRSIDAITPTRKQMDIMKSDGTLDKIENMIGETP